MEIEIRKYRLMQRLMNIEKESIINAFESLLSINEQEEQKLEQELTKRLESYHNNPEDLLDWDEMKNDW